MLFLCFMLFFFYFGCCDGISTLKLINAKYFNLKILSLIEVLSIPCHLVKITNNETNKKKKNINDEIIKGRKIEHFIGWQKQEQEPES